MNLSLSSWKKRVKLPKNLKMPLPYWNTYEEVNWAFRFLSVIAWSFGLIAAFATTTLYFYGNRREELANAATAAEAKRLRNVISSLTSHLDVEYSWTDPKAKPLLDDDQGGGIGPEVHLELSAVDAWAEPGSARVVFLRAVPYKIEPLADRRAAFHANLAVTSEFPIHSQMTDLAKMRFARVLIPIKGYWPSRDHYPLTVHRISLSFSINGETRSFSIETPSSAMPRQTYSNTIIGYIDQTLQLPCDIFREI